MELYEEEYEDTPFKWYRPDEVDEYIVVVNLPEDWSEVHNYIINENEIDGIPNRKIECANDKAFSLRSSVYMMSHEEAEILKTHPKVEDVELNPEKFPQPESLFSLKFRKVVAFSKPRYTLASDTTGLGVNTAHSNGVRSNWSHMFVNGGQFSSPFQGVGITTTTLVNRDTIYSLSGKGVDAVIIDSGVSVLHPDFIADDGTYRVRDVILDAPYKVDPAAFSGYTETVTIDGVNIGTRAQEARARSWWSNTSIRSAAFQSLGTVTISASYTRIHAHSKNGSNPITNTHGTCCASQIGGKWHGLAFECNLWNIRIALGGAGGIISSSTALDACTIFHKAKKIAQDVADPTLINNSYGSSSQTGNTSSTNYTIGYRGTSQTYTGTGSLYSIPTNSGGARCNATFTFNNASNNTQLVAFNTHGNYLNPSSTTSSAAENAIAAGCIVVASAGNNNQKLSDKDDVDFDNWYGNSSTFINRVGGVQKGFSGDHIRTKGSIRVGAIDCAVEPPSERQGVTKYKFRKVAYSSNGPMISVWAPGEQTMAAAYASGENYQREDDNDYYDKWFNGTSSAGPNACSVIALELETNRKATQNDIHKFFDSGPGAVTTDKLSDPYPNPNDAAYWSMDYYALYDGSANPSECYNVRGNGNLRGAPKRVLNNPYASNLKPTFAGVVGGESIITTDLVLNLDGNNYTSGSTWNDSSGGSRNATFFTAPAVINNPTSDTSNGGSIVFDDTNPVEYAQTGTVSAFLIGTKNYTMSLWFKFDDVKAEMSLMDNRTAHGDGTTFGIFQSGSYMRVKVWEDNANTFGFQSSTNLSVNTWYNITYTRISNSATMYINGIKDGSSWTQNYNYSSGNKVTVAWNYSLQSNKSFDGSIGQVLFYVDKGFTESEVLQNYDAMKGRYLDQPLILSGISYSLA